jgi:short-subunit dehydrogenase
MGGAIDGGTVLVTGASSGIGVEIARLVAPRAAALVLVARRVDRLAKLREELVGARPALRVEIIGADLSRREDVARLVAEVHARGLTVDVLVNNAGVGLMSVFDRADVDKTMAMVELNVSSVTRLTAAFLPGMVERGRGGVLNVSSGFGLAFLPTFAAYVATKHFVTGLTEALVADLAGTGVTATQVCPGPVATEFEENVGNFTGRKPPRLVEISAAACARAAVRGFDRGSAMVIPGTAMKLVMMLNGITPRFVRRLFASALGRAARRHQIEREASVSAVAGAIKEVPPDVRA